MLGCWFVHMARGTVFGVFEVPNGFDPNQVSGELLAVYTVTVGELKTICVQGSDEDGVDLVPISLPLGMQLESVVENPGRTEARYAWQLDVNDVGLHYVILGFIDHHPSDPLMTEATIVIEVIHPPNAGAPEVALCL